MINEQLRARLLRTGYDVQVTAQPDQFVPAQTDVAVHHDYTQDFRTSPRPVQGHWVVIRTWDFGPFPADMG